jgi:uncharacterized protein with PhoU and TrkA domain
MKKKIDFMIDLAYSAIKFSSKEIADETSKIEKRIHELVFLLNLQIIQTQAGGVKEFRMLLQTLLELYILIATYLNSRNYFGMKFLNPL